MTSEDAALCESLEEKGTSSSSGSSGHHSWDEAYDEELHLSQTDIGLIEEAEDIRTPSDGEDEKKLVTSQETSPGWWLKVLQDTAAQIRLIRKLFCFKLILVNYIPPYPTNCSVRLFIHLRLASFICAGLHGVLLNGL